MSKSNNLLFKLDFFCWRLKGQWQKIQDPDPNPDDPLVRGMDPRIRIHPKCHGSATLPGIEPCLLVGRSAHKQEGGPHKGHNYNQR